MMFKTSVTNLIHFTLPEKEFNFVVSCIDVYRPMAKFPEALDRVKDKMLRKSLIDKPRGEMKCALNDTDFYILFSILVTNGMANALNVPADYFSRCARDPEVKPWVSKERKS